MGSDKLEEVTFHDRGGVSKVEDGTKKLIIVKNVPKGAFLGHETMEEIVIEEGVQSIGDYSFAACKNLKTIIFPSTIKEIGERAFCDCKNLEKVDLSKTKIPQIYKGTFSSCKNLKSIVFPSTIKDIGEGAFYKCEDLTTIIIPASVTWIEKEAFSRCEKLIVVTFLSKSTKIHEEVFEKCHALPSFMYENNIINESTNNTTEDQATEIQATEILDKLSITENMREYEYKNNDTIRVVEVEEGVERIGGWAFQECTSIESVKLPQSLHDIGIGAFKFCKSLQEINIPENVTVVSDDVFHGCSSLKKATLSSYTRKINSRAFATCESLRKIEIPKSVKELGQNAFGDGYVFEGCTSLEEVKFDKDSEIKTIKPYTFYQCSSLKEMDLPSTVTEIEDHTFSGCSSLKSINIHDNITTIGEGAFSGCASLESICIPSKQTQIYENTFKNCASLTSLTIPRSVNKIAKDAFCGCTSLREVTIQNPGIEIGEGAFAGCDALENIRGLPSSEENIKSYLDKKIFKGCISLKNPIGNEIHLAAEGKCWEGDMFPQDGHLWIQQALKEKNEQRKKALREAIGAYKMYARGGAIFQERADRSLSSSEESLNSESDSNEVEPQDESSSSPSTEILKDDASFQKDYNGHTAFWCAVRGGAPDEFLNVLAQGFDENGKTHLDIFVEKYARKQPEDFTADELAFLIELNSKLIAATPIGKGRHYIDSLEELLQGPILDPRKVPEFIRILNNIFKSKVFAFLLMLEFIIPVMRIISFVKISDVYFDENRTDKAHIVWFVLMYVSIGYLFIREFFQIYHGFSVYLTNMWNWYDICIIITTTLATIMMHTTDYVVKRGTKMARLSLKIARIIG